MDILFEDNHILAVNKACGQIVQGDKTGDTPLVELLKARIKERDTKPGNVFLGVTHRIDRPTSGVVLFAKTGKALSRLNALFRDKLVEKSYWAVVEGRPPAAEGRLEHNLYKNEVQNKSYVSGAEQAKQPASRQAKQAVMTYRTLSEAERYTLLEVRMETGRHHQIRCQLAYIGCPIKGDLKYGARRSNPGGGIHLHARSVSFEHPVTHENVSITAPPPEDPVWNLFPAPAGPADL
ncbi:MAG: RluA family pseudouridine synthase [Spirochaetales bacterium]|nr:MAG: RluA family pseudouridine synthase [Spirochaetales bacterium]